ncbi:uncharacterized protein [Antedon mediterranea]|uniref:uncharacterized protein n=1 Tax=Antedon mediterranea TaxID=105859 RepID=UPI003AF7FEDD
MSSGTRVVRSAFWKQGKLDGGEGHLGTIFEPEDKPTFSEKSYVVWDNGNETVCEIGEKGELLVYDNAPTGATHANVTCGACSKEAFLGVRWKCNDCSNYDLCNLCYMKQEHEMDHQFLRITHDGGQRVFVGKRHGSVVLQAWGICAGAEVTRGKHWKWGDQDGGDTGVVKLIANWNKTSWRSGARVEWKNGSIKGYRVGYDGAVDLKFVKERKGDTYYRDHLAYVKPRDNKDVKASEAAAAQTKSAELLEGDQVIVKKVSIDLFRMMQSDYGGFSDDLAKVVGKTGTVETILTHKGEVYPRIKLDGQVYTINPKLLEKVTKAEDDDFLKKISNESTYPKPTGQDTHSKPQQSMPQKSMPRSKTSYKVGDEVRLKWINKSEFEELQEGFGGFVDKMLEVRCKTGTVQAIKAGNVPNVLFQDSTVWNLNPACLELVNKTNKTDETDDFVQTTYPSQSQKEKPTEQCNSPVIKTTKFASGDKVRVRKIEEYQMREMQKDYTEFDADMKSVCGKTGTVLGVDDDTKAVTVSLGGRSFKFNPACINLIEQGPRSKKLYGSLSSTTDTKTDDGPIRRGDVVRVKSSLSMDSLMKLQSGHGGFVLELTQTIGETGNVMEVDSDGDVHVSFSTGRNFYFNPACLELVSRGDGTSSYTGRSSLEGELLRLLIGQSTVSLIVAAAANGDLSTVDQCIRRNPSSVDTMHQNVTALMAAAGKGHKNIADRLLQGGANIEKTDKDRWTAIFFAVNENHPHIVEFLLSKSCNANVRSNNGSTCLHLASRKGFDKCVTVLMATRFNCDPNIKDNDGDTALHDAVSQKHSNVTAILVNNPRIDLLICNNKGILVIHSAAAHGDVMSIKKIVEKKPGLTNTKATDGLTPLHVAARYDSHAVVKYFISLPMCNKNIQDKSGSTPLHHAVTKGNNTVIEVLVKGGANMNIRDNDGDTCLHIALMISRVSLPPELQLLGLLAGANVGVGDDSKGFAIASFLVLNGADLSIKNNRGKRPIDLVDNMLKRNKLIAIQQKRKLRDGGLNVF